MQMTTRNGQQYMTHNTGNKGERERERLPEQYKREWGDLCGWRRSEELAAILDRIGRGPAAIHSSSS